MSYEDADSASIKRICFDCVGDEYLSSVIDNDGKRRKCSYCGAVTKTFSVGELAVRVEAAFEEHYYRTSNEPTDWQLSLMRDKESDYDWDRDGMPVIEAIIDSASISYDSAVDVQCILSERHECFDSDCAGEETEFSGGSYYEERGRSGLSWNLEWRRFEKHLKNEARFFSNTALGHLQKIFYGIGEMNTPDGRPLLVKAGPETDFKSVYRARVFQSDDELEDAVCFPDRNLGPPPAKYASAGRMNARGISVFYGSNNHHAAVAEVRPPVGSKVVTAKFEIIRSIVLLDLTALNSVRVHGSVFDPTYGDRLEHAMFLRSFCQRITRPVMPDDEAMDYLATQAVADFLATAADVEIDGIIFPSVQNAGAALNVVLFHKAARVEAIDVIPGSQITLETGRHDEDGTWEVDYCIYEEVPTDGASDSVHVENSKSINPNWANSDNREDSLRIIIDSLTVHSVNSVQFLFQDFPISRYRFEKTS